MTSFFTLYILPEELTLRDFSTSAIIGYGLFVSFVFISVAKLFKSDLYKMLFLSNFKIKNIDIFLKENYSLNRPESLFLALNFFVSISLILYILFDFPKFGVNFNFLFVIFFPLLFIIFSLLSVLLTAILFGEYKMIHQLLFFRILGLQFIGIIYMIIVGMWLFTNQSTHTFILAAVIVTIIEFVVRIFKSWVSVLQKNVPWYYIILYFCTLEILPLMILYHFIKGFSG